MSPERSRCCNASTFEKQELELDALTPEHICQFLHVILSAGSQLTVNDDVGPERVNPDGALDAQGVFCIAKAAPCRYAHKRVGLLRGQLETVDRGAHPGEPRVALGGSDGERGVAHA